MKLLQSKEMWLCVLYLYRPHIHQECFIGGGNVAAPVFVIMSCTCNCFQEYFISGGNVAASICFCYLFMYLLSGAEMWPLQFFFIIYSCHTYAVVIRSVLFGRKFGCSFFFIYSCHAHVVVIRNVLQGAEMWQLQFILFIYVIHNYL